MNCYPCERSGIKNRAWYYTPAHRVPVCRKHIEMVWNEPSRETIYWRMRPYAMAKESQKVVMEKRVKRNRLPAPGTRMEGVLNYAVAHVKEHGKLPSPTKLAEAVYGDKRWASNAHTTVCRLIARGLIKLEVEQTA